PANEQVKARIHAMGPKVVPYLVNRLRQESSLARLRQKVFFPARILENFGWVFTSKQTLHPQATVAEALLQEAPSDWEQAIGEAIKPLLLRGGPGEQQVAIRILREHPEVCLDLLSILDHVLVHGDKALILQTLELIRPLGERARPLDRTIVSLFAHTDQTIQCKAILLAPKLLMDAQLVFPRLIPFLNSMPGSYRRRVAVQALAGIATPDAVQIAFLRDALEDPEEDTRHHAARGLGRLGKDALSSLDTLIPLLEDEVVGIRMTAADAIGNMGVEAADAIPGLIRAMNNDFSGVGQHCRRAIEKIDPAKAKFIIVR
ncbi:MAG: HEAT repeat domain-containing protein, partial [Verrucomicrobiota bacterium]|nr:HEAT repeat domain-containing protein [Verrucomicrobiota bacterium]